MPPSRPAGAAAWPPTAAPAAPTPAPAAADFYTLKSYNGSFDDGTAYYEFTQRLGYALLPILIPFAAALLLTYICYPAQKWLTSHRINANLAAILVLLGLTLAGSAFLLVLVPLLIQQMQAFYGAFIKLFTMAQASWLPDLQTRLGLSFTLDIQHLTDWISRHSEGLSAAMPGLLKSLGSQGLALAQILVNLALIPVVFFYLLRDADMLTPRMLKLAPRRIAPTMSSLLAKNVGTVDRAETDGQKLAGMMIGKELTESHYEKVDASGREIVAELDHVDYNKESKHSGLADLSLRIHAGEIVGVAGVDGNGQTPKSPAFNEAFNAAGSPWQLLVQNAVWGSGDLKADNKAVTDVLSAQ